jgi:hypothetical protein
MHLDSPTDPRSQLQGAESRQVLLMPARMVLKETIVQSYATTEPEGPTAEKHCILMSKTASHFAGRQSAGMAVGYAVELQSCTEEGCINETTTLILVGIRGNWLRGICRSKLGDA